MPALEVTAFRAGLDAGAVPLDLRPPAVFAAGHVPGAILLPFGRHDLGKRAELFLPKDPTYALVMEPAVLGPTAEDLLASAGYAVAGHLAGGMKAWLAAGLPTERIPVIEVDELHRQVANGSLHVLDVREPFEYDWAHIPGARLVPHGAIWERAADLERDRPWHVVCAGMSRSGAAASILRRLGFADVTLVNGGTSTWVEAGFPVERGGSG